MSGCHHGHLISQQQQQHGGASSRNGCDARCVVMVNMIDDAVTTCEDDFHDVTMRTSFNP